MSSRNPPAHKRLTGFVRLRNRRGNRLAFVLLRITRRDFGFCLLNGGASRILINIGYYLGRFGDGSESFTHRALPFPSQVVYNRAGKCGSRTIVLLLRILADRHRFTLISSYIQNKTRLSRREQANVIRNISSAPLHFLYTRHVHFLNFSWSGSDEPAHINIIRDPIHRFVSNYFFRRFGDWRGEPCGPHAWDEG